VLRDPSAATEFPLAFVARFVNRFTTLRLWSKAVNARSKCSDGALRRIGNADIQIRGLDLRKKKRGGRVTIFGLGIGGALLCRPVRCVRSRA
jgi:uncharacterized protein YjeT (DUF2065 family)